MLPMEDVANPSVDAMDAAVTALVVPTALAASTTTTAAITESKANVKKELTAAKREVQNENGRRLGVDEQARKAEALARSSGGREMRAPRVKAMKMWELLSDVNARVYSCRQCWASKCRGL
jgi:hypothetical protein